MRNRRFAGELIASILAERKRGMATAELCLRLGITSATFYRWKAKYGGIDVSDARRLKTLETENGRLKKLLAGSLTTRSLKTCWERTDDVIQRKRDAAPKVMSKYDISQRRAYKLVRVAPKTVRRQCEPDNPEIRKRMREIAAWRHGFRSCRIELMMPRTIREI